GQEGVTNLRADAVCLEGAEPATPRLVIEVGRGMPERHYEVTMRRGPARRSRGIAARSRATRHSIARRRPVRNPVTSGGLEGEAIVTPGPFVRMYSACQSPLAGPRPR